MYIPVISPVFGWLFKAFYNIFGQNYLVSLFMFAVAMKLLLLPFGIKQQKNSLKQARMRPKEIAIRNKYKGREDQKTKQKMQEEIMKLYQEENFNPMSGCLPLLIQMPILFALYGVITKPITYISNFSGSLISKLTASEIDIISKVVKSGDEIKNFFNMEGLDTTALVSELSEINNSFTVFGLDLTEHPNFTWPLVVIPILTFIFSFGSTKLIRKFTYQPQAGDAQTQASLGMMDWMMPLMSVWIAFQLSAAIAVYWIFQNILSAVQQYVLYKMYPVPPVTEQQIREAELQLKGKSKSGNKAVVLSDDDIDDYDKTTEAEKTAGNNKKKGDNVMSSRKAGISPKVKELYKNGKRLKARKKI